MQWTDRRKDREKKQKDKRRKTDEYRQRDEGSNRRRERERESEGLTGRQTGRLDRQGDKQKCTGKETDDQSMAAQNN